MFAVKSITLAAVVLAGSALPSAASAQQVAVTVAPAEVQIEPVRWRRPYYRPNVYYRPYVNRPYVGAYPYYNYSYRPYWRGYYYYGPSYYYW
jgi:hypothetical protein